MQYPLTTNRAEAFPHRITSLCKERLLPRGSECIADALTGRNEACYVNSGRDLLGRNSYSSYMNLRPVRQRGLDKK